VGQISREVSVGSSGDKKAALKYAPYPATLKIQSLRNGERTSKRSQFWKKWAKKVAQ
jgi:hypothetical protein